MGPKVSSEKRRQTIEEERDELKVVLNIHNRLPVSHEIFSQSRATVHSIELKESEDCFRFDSAIFAFDRHVSSYSVT